MSTRKLSYMIVTEVSILNVKKSESFLIPDVDESGLAEFMAGDPEFTSPTLYPS